MPLQVLGAGHGRTGTTSLKLALEQIGFGPCYHMTEVFKNGGPHIKAWTDAFEGRPVDWHALFAKYHSTTDYPGSCFLTELMEAFPDAKVILTVRDPEQWYESTLHTIFAISHNWATDFFTAALPPFARLSRMLGHLWNTYPFKGNFLDRTAAIAAFNAHNERVKSTVPADKLLVFNVKEGWAPLCAFLGVPIPDTPFPRVNEQAEMERRLLGIKVAAGAVLATTAMLAGLAAVMVQRHFL